MGVGWTASNDADYVARSSATCPADAVTPGSGEPLPDYLRIPLGRVIRAWRQAQGLTLEDLASRAGSPFSRGYLSQLENDRIHTPGEEKLAQLAAALGVDPLVLVTRQFPDEGASPATGEARVPTSTTRDSAEIGVSVDVAPLLAALAGLPPSRQQQYVDALVSLVERLSRGEPHTAG